MDPAAMMETLKNGVGQADDRFTVGVDTLPAHHAKADAAVSC